MDEALAAGAEEPRIVVADDEVIVAWKPHRMHCAELPSARGGPSLAAWVNSRFPETAPSAFAAAFAAVFAATFADVIAADPRNAGAPKFPDGGLLHRLDFETAGLVLFARTAEALLSLRRAQESDSIEKTYRLACSPSTSCASRPA